MRGIYSRFDRRLDPAGAPRPGVFLDRDGVIVDEVGYLDRPSAVRPIEGALEGIARLNRSGWPVVVVTNQAGIGRGYYGWQEFEQVEGEIERQLAGAGGWLDGVWACAYHPQGRGELLHPDHPFRKPNPGMLIEAARSLRLDLARSWLVGDKVCDIGAAISGGLAGAVHVLTGHGEKARGQVEALPAGGDRAPCRLHYCDALPRAVDWLLERAPE